MIFYLASVVHLDALHNMHFLLYELFYKGFCQLIRQQCNGHISKVDFLDIPMVGFKLYSYRF